MSATIFGYGSCMSPVSVHRTCASATLFRPAVLSGYERTFNLVSISGIRSGAADRSTNEIASLAIRPAAGLVCGCVFTIPESELAPYLEREHRYRVVKVVAQVVTDPHSWTPPLKQLQEQAQSPSSAETVECWTVVAQVDHRAPVCSLSDLSPYLRAVVAPFPALPTPHLCPLVSPTLTNTPFTRCSPTVNYTPLAHPYSLTPPWFTHTADGRGVPGSAARCAPLHRL